jgi:hypothetical protein
MHVQTTSGSAGAAFGIIGAGVALALPDEKWIGWIIAAIGVAVFMFDAHIDGWHIRFKWPKLQTTGALIFLCAILFGGYWYAAHLPASRQAEVPLPRPRPSEAPSQQAENVSSPEQPLVSTVRPLRSTMTKMIYVCDKSDKAKTKLSPKEIQAELKQYASVMEAIFGVIVEYNEMPNGYRFQYTPTGVDALTVSKQIIEMRRLNQYVRVTVVSEMNGTFQLMLMWATASADDPPIKTMTSNIEHVVGASEGKCKLI